MKKSRNDLETVIMQAHQSCLELFIDKHYSAALLENYWLTKIYLSNFTLSYFDWYMAILSHLFAFLLLFASIKYFTNRQNSYEYYYFINVIHIFMSLGILFDYGWFCVYGYCFGDYRAFMYFRYSLFHCYAYINFVKLKRVLQHCQLVILARTLMDTYKKLFDTNFRFTFMPKGF
uniref:Transmembrane protein n=1 Tax=Panagrolaimus davidi TaxID=227884 RepID=A0A914QW02_9BILA